MKVLLGRIIISICLGIATYVGYSLPFSSSDMIIAIVPALIATVSAFCALYINDLIDVIKKK